MSQAVPLARIGGPVELDVVVGHHMQSDLIAGEPSESGRDLVRAGTDAKWLRLAPIEGQQDAVGCEASSRITKDC